MTDIVSKYSEIDGETRQLVGQKSDGAAATTPSTDGCPSGETELPTSEEYSKEGENVTLKSGDTRPNQPVEDTPADVAEGVRLEDVAIGEHVPVTAPASDIDLDQIALDQDFQSLIAVKTESAAPKIRKPGKQTWFSPWPEQSRWRAFLTIEDDSDGDLLFVIDPGLAPDLEGEYMRKLLVPCITRQNSLFFWPIKLPDEGGKIDPWNESSLEIATSKGDQWIRLKSNHNDKCYEVLSRKIPLKGPVWPEDIEELLKKTIAKVYINTLEHPLIKRLLEGD